MTGVQTCALPIFFGSRVLLLFPEFPSVDVTVLHGLSEVLLLFSELLPVVLAVFASFLADFLLLFAVILTDLGVGPA